MADQEFLASFAVDIDEAGVARLQTIPSENRTQRDGPFVFRDAVKLIRVRNENQIRAAEASRT